MSFATDIAGFQDEVRKKHRDAVRRVASMVYQGVTTSSPVDTGRFRASWTITWDTPDENIAPPATGPGENSGGSVTVPFVEQKLAAARGDFPEAWINNSISYGQPLEDRLAFIATTLATVEARI